MSELPEATRRLVSRVPGFDFRVEEFPQGTKTAEDAAVAIGCPVSAIVKSLVFILTSDDGDEPVLALVPGDLRLDTDALASVAGGAGTRRATLEEVREATGYAAGGHAPVWPRLPGQSVCRPGNEAKRPGLGSRWHTDDRFPDLDRRAGPVRRTGLGRDHLMRGTHPFSPTAMV